MNFLQYRSFSRILFWPVILMALVAGLIMPLGQRAFAAQLRRAIAEDVISLDPQQARRPQARLLARDLFEGLVTLDVERRPVPGAAASWRAHDGGHTIDFHLRQDGRWSNGDLVRADDFVASFRTLLASGDAWGRFLLSSVINSDRVADGRSAPTELGVEALSDLTLRMRLKHPDPWLITALADVALAPLHERVAKSADRRGMEASELPSNGPYQIQSLDEKGGRLILQRNSYYYGRASIAIGEVHYIRVHASESRRERYTRGDLDVVAVADQDLAWSQQNIPDELNGPEILAASYLVVEDREGPLAKTPDLRRALSLALDRDALTSTLSPSGLQPLHSLTPGPLSGHVPETAPFSSLSPGERRRLAAELMTARQAGSVPSPMSLRLCYDVSGPIRQQVLAIGLMWNLELSAQVRTIPSFRSESSVSAPCHIRAITLHLDVADPVSLLAALGQEILSPPDDFWTSLNAARAESDPSQRERSIRSAERVLLGTHWVIPLWRDVADVLVKPKVKGWRSPDPFLPSRFLQISE